MNSSHAPSRAADKWRDLYQSAVLEPDYRRLFDRIAEARAAILLRVDTLPKNPSNEERRALSSSLRTLELLEGAAHHRRTAA